MPPAQPPLPDVYGGGDSRIIGPDEMIITVDPDRCDESTCCMLITDLKWRRPLFAFILDAVRDPHRFMLIWFALAAIIVTIATAFYIGLQSRVRRNWQAELENANLNVLADFLWVWVWLGTRVVAVFVCCVRKICGPEKCHVFMLGRISSALFCAVSALLPSLNFWFDVLFIDALLSSEDTRVHPYGLVALALLSAGCVVSTYVAIKLMFKGLKVDVDGRAMLYNDTDAYRGDATATWSLLVFFSCLASPTLLKLLPWNERRYGGLPTMEAMLATFRISTAMSAVMFLIKALQLLRFPRAGVSSSSSLAMLSMIFNGLLLLRTQLQRALYAASVRATERRKDIARDEKDLLEQRAREAERLPDQRLIMDQDVSGFFTPTARNDRRESITEDAVAEGAVLNPVLLGKMKLKDERDKKAREKAIKQGSAKSGGLARLNFTMDSAADETSEANKLDRYLSRVRKVVRPHKEPRTPHPWSARDSADADGLESSKSERDSGASGSASIAVDWKLKSDLTAFGMSAAETTESNAAFTLKVQRARHSITPARAVVAPTRSKLARQLGDPTGSRLPREFPGEVNSKTDESVEEESQV